jgi:L-ascorbate metabolism protein UlaG (beta-lactamase superfamily)
MAGIGGAVMKNVHWLGHAGFMITGSKTVYVDPYEIRGGKPADLILITHEHYDHCSPGDLQKILAPDTVIVAAGGAGAKLAGRVKTVKPGDSLAECGLSIQAVPAYNFKLPNHAKTAIPMHWGSVIGSIEDAQKFCRLCKCEAVIPDME